VQRIAHSPGSVGSSERTPLQAEVDQPAVLLSGILVGDCAVVCPIRLIASIVVDVVLYDDDRIRVDKACILNFGLRRRRCGAQTSIVQTTLDDPKVAA